MSPIAPDPADRVHFGFVPGQQYALRWPSNLGKSDYKKRPPAGSACSGDLALGWGAGSTIDRARISGNEVGWWGSQSGSRLDAWIRSGYPDPLSPGDVIAVSSGVHGRRSAIQQRVTADSDSGSRTHDAYERTERNGFRLGNGSRVVLVPVNRGPVDYSPDFKGGDKSGGKSRSGEKRPILGFAAFFLHERNYGRVTGNQPICAEYVGGYAQGANTHAGGPAGVSSIRMVR
jgi:hypothetical protein